LDLVAEAADGSDGESSEEYEEGKVETYPVMIQ
jgi:hypothetical protein